MSRAHAVVFGASSGLGAAVAARLAKEGHVVSGLSRGPSAAADASFPCDVTDDASVRDAVAASIAAHGPPLLVVYAAGVPAMGKTLEVDAAEARRAFEVNFWGFDRAVRAVLPAMAKQRRGAIVLVSSIVAVRAVPHEAYYAASKAAAARYAGCVAFEAASSGVDVKMLHVGFVDTGFAQKSAWRGLSPPPRGRGAGSGVGPDDVADALVRLVRSSRTSAVVGWKEQAIVLGDRVVPELYDRLLKLRGGAR